MVVALQRVGPLWVLGPGGSERKLRGAGGQQAGRGGVGGRGLRSPLAPKAGEDEKRFRAGKTGLDRGNRLPWG